MEYIETKKLSKELNWVREGSKIGNEIGLTTDKWVIFIQAVGLEKGDMTVNLGYETFDTEPEAKAAWKLIKLKVNRRFLSPW